MIGQAPIGLAPIGGWWQTAGITLPVFRCPAHRVIRLDQVARFESTDQVRFETLEQQSRHVTL